MPAADPPLPASDLDLADPAVVIDLFHQASDLYLNDPDRRGAVMEPGDRGRLLVTGDLHDHGLNFHRILKLARLHKSATNRLVFQEVIHGPSRVNGRDLSIRTLARIAALKVERPKQVTQMQSNHELAQLGGEGILKDGSSVVEDFDAGVEFLYGDEAGAVTEAMNDYVRSLPLAVRCANGVMASHSLPSPRKIKSFDAAILDRVPGAADLAFGGDGYNMVWGRNHTSQMADDLADAWDVQWFVVGHQPVEMGYDVEAERILIINSDHDHGVALPIDLAKEYDMDDLVGQIVPLASVVT